MGFPRGLFARGFSNVINRTEGWLAGLLAAAVLSAGVVFATTAASGADSFGYVSQADLWLEGKLTVDVPAIRQVPWRSSIWSFTPLGYRPTDDQSDPWKLVPVYAPGLPLLLAGAKAFAGQEGMFWVVPISGAILVLATFGIGLRLGSSKLGLIGAWLVATSPPILFMLMSPMTDVPVAAAWTAAFFFLLGRSRTDAIAAGLGASLAILVRPNLVPLLVAPAVLHLLRVWRDADRRHAVGHAIAFGGAALIGPLSIAVFNQMLYGSPFVSGYGRLQGMFAVDHVWPNVRNYVIWLVEVQTLAAIAGLAAILLPARWLWPFVRDRAAFIAIGLFVVGLWVYYCVYLVFDAWWYLRFVLSCLPFIMLGVGAIALAIARKGGRLGLVVATLAVLLLGAYEFRLAVNYGVFGIWREEQRYVAVAKLVRQLTDPNSVVLAMQHSGSLRYYAGRTTLRYDILDRRRIDTAISWLTDHGSHVYLLAEEWELPTVRERFAGYEALERLGDPPVFTYNSASTIFFFDLSSPRDRLTAPMSFDETRLKLRSVPPAETPSLLRQGFPE